MAPILASFGTGLAATVFVVICLLLIFVVLIQKGRGGGLSGAFGGAGGHTAFGAKTGDVFTWITVGLATLFIIMGAGLTFVFKPIELAPSVQVTMPTDAPVVASDTPVAEPITETAAPVETDSATE